MELSAVVSCVVLLMQLSVLLSTSLTHD